MKKEINRDKKQGCTWSGLGQVGDFLTNPKVRVGWIDNPTFYFQVGLSGCNSKKNNGQVRLGIFLPIQKFGLVGLITQPCIFRLGCRVVTLKKKKKNYLSTFHNYSVEFQVKNIRISTNTNQFIIIKKKVINKYGNILT